MDYIAELAAIAKEHGGIIETKIAAQHGISKAMLYKLCKEDKIHRIVKGQYILPDDMEDELLSISKRSTQIIFSHETALFLHGISDRTPFEHTITAPSGCIPSAAIKAECKVYYIKPELFETAHKMGRITDKQLALVLHFIDDPDAFMRSFLLAHPDFLANELAKGGKSAQRAQLCIDSGFAPAEALPKAFEFSDDRPDMPEQQPIHTAAEQPGGGAKQPAENPAGPAVHAA